MKPVKFFCNYDNITVNLPGLQPFLLKDYKAVKGKINKLEIELVRAV